MNLYLFLSLAGCLVSALCSLTILLRDPEHPANRIASLLIGLSAWWGVCQVLLTVAPSEDVAQFWHHLGGPGWAFIGPLALNLVVELAPKPPGWMRRILPAAYGIGACFGLLQLGTNWLHGAALKTPWGWGFEAGPGHSWYLVFTFGCLAPAIQLALAGIRRSSSPATRAQLRFVAIGISAPLVLAGLTSGIFPVLGIQIPRLGSISLAVLALTRACSYQRYGY